MHAIANRIIVEADQLASRGANLSTVLEQLRKLGLDDFGALMISLPNASYSSLSALLPPMASFEVQKTMTGSAGTDLLRQTVAFTRLMESNFIRYAGRPLHGAKVLDFGCGYGRFVRMLYYYTDPSSIWAVDAWAGSLAQCTNCRLAGNFALSQEEPESLPIDDTMFDLAFAFSIFTHLSPATATKCLSAIRNHMNPGGIFLATIRPVEFWSHYDKVKNLDIAGGMVETHNETGIAYKPHEGERGKTYGDISLALEFMEQPGWRLEGYDSSIVDPFQIAAVLLAV
jgi:SAM-dependent methyltransferase